MEIIKKLFKLDKTSNESEIPKKSIRLMYENLDCNHLHLNYKFSDKIIFTNNYEKIGEILDLMNKFQRNLESYFPIIFSPFSTPNLIHIEDFLELKYLIKTQHEIPLVEAVIFVDNSKIKALNRFKSKKGKLPEEELELNEDYEDPNFDDLKSNEFEGFYTKKAKSNIVEPTFNEKEPKKVYEYKNIISYGSYQKLTMEEIQNEINDSAKSVLYFSDPKRIEPYTNELTEYMDKKYNVVFLDNNISQFSSNLDYDPNSFYFKTKIAERFNVAVMNDYLNKKGLEITLAQEVGHILFGHLENTTRLWVNRETQANFLASLMLNDKIDSIYLEYLTNFMTKEYQRTMLFHNDFDTTNLVDALIKVLNLK